MRLIAVFLLLAACSPEQPQPKPETLLFAGNGRDRLCIAGDRIGFIAYSSGDTNCSVRGRIDRSAGQALTIIPDGDQDCRIAAENRGGSVRLGALAPACAYYCGPGTSFAGKTFRAAPAASPAVDFAGDRLC